MKKICEVCGKEFEARQYNQKYCSKKCGKKAGHEKEKLNRPKLQDKVCIICGKTFTPRVSTQITCNDKKRKTEHNRIRNKALRNSPKMKKEIKKCIICGEEFIAKNSNQILCEKEECRKERMSRQKRNIPEENYKDMIGVFTFKENKNIRICPVCGKEFESKSWNQIYCSEKCQEKQVCIDRPNNLDKPRVCEECGKEFIPNSSSQKYCKECVDIIRKRTQKRYNDNKPRKDYEPIPCLYCGELFKPKKSSEKYCCKEHQELHYKESGYNKRISHEHYINNIERYHEQRKKYYEEHKEETRERAKRNRLKPRNADDLLKDNIRQQVYAQIKNNGKTKDFHTFELLGYTSQDLKERLESLFEQNSKEGKPKLSWDNYGSVWHVDHIQPQSSFKFVNEDNSLNKEAIKKCWRLDNLQPLYAEDNIRKSSYDENGIF